MGAFVLLRHADRPQREQAAKAAHASLLRQGFREPRIISTSTFKLLLCEKTEFKNKNFVSIGMDRFAFGTGTFAYKGDFGARGLRNFLESFDPQFIDWDDFRGQFCVGFYGDSKLQIFIDRMGNYKVYLDSNSEIFSSSFVTILDTLEDITINVQSIYEYIFQGATYGDETIIKEISLLSSEYRFNINKNIDKINNDDIIFSTLNVDIDNIINSTLETINNYFSDLYRSFKNNIDTALSGGYDSRFILSMLLLNGSVPRVHVYGGDGDIDVKIAREIAEGEEIKIIHTDKSLCSKMDINGFSNIIEANFLSFDGCPSDGIFDTGEDLATRRQRCAGRALALNGGGGEVFRNFFYLPDRPLTIRQILFAFYCQFDPRICTDLFHEQRYLDSLGAKIGRVLKTKDDHISRGSAEFLYPGFRCRFWTGRNTSVNNRFGWALTPFTDFAVVRDAFRIPLKYKNFGRFEAALIHATSPQLAAYDSGYGHNFSGPPPLRRIAKDLATILRPTSLRRLSYRLKHRRPVTYPYYLQQPYIETVLDPSFPAMSAFLHMDRINDVTLFNRACTLEYLFAKYAITS